MLGVGSWASILTLNYFHLLLNQVDKILNAQIAPRFNHASRVGDGGVRFPCNEFRAAPECVSVKQMLGGGGGREGGREGKKEGAGAEP